MKCAARKLMGLALAGLLLTACPDKGKHGQTTPPPNGEGGAGQGEGDGTEPGIAKAPTKPKIKLTAKEKKSYEKAVKVYEKLAHKAADSGWSEGMCEKASSAFAAVADTNPRLEAHARHNQAVIWLHCGKTAKARGILESIISKKPNFSPSLVSLGYLAREKGQVSRAKSFFERAYLADPRNAEASFNLGVCYRERAQKHKMSESERQRIRSLRFPNGYPVYAKWMSQVEARGHVVGFAELAIRHLQTVLAITSGQEDPDSQVLNMRAYALMALVYADASQEMRSKLTLAKLVINEANSSLKDYKMPLCRGGGHVTGMDKAVAELRNVDGLIELKKEQLVQAMKKFSAAVQCNPKFLEAHMNIGAIALGFRGYRRAMDHFRAVLALQPNNLDAIMGLGVAFRGLSAEAMADEKDKMLEKAEAQYKKVLSLAPRTSRPYADALYNLGLLYQDYKAGNNDAENKARLRTAMSYYDKYVAHPKALLSAKKDALSRKSDIIRTIQIMAQMAEIKRKEQERERLRKAQEAARPAPRQPRAPARPRAR